jgi:hypothetical protein
MAVLSLEANERLEAYLAEVAEILQGDGHDLADIKNIIDSLREQIHEIATLGGQRSASLDEIEQALAELEPPEAFRAASRVLAIKTKHRATKRMLAYLSAGLSIGAVLAYFAVAAVHQPVPPIYSIGQVAALAAGLASWSEPVGRFGAICAALLIIGALLGPK